MSLLRRGFLMMSVVSLLTATQAFAGGNGGTKKNATIKVTNESTQTVGVYYDSTNSKIQSAFTDTTSAQALSDFKAGGGVILSPGGTTTFSVKAGAYTFVAFDQAQAAVGYSAMPATSPPSGIIATMGIIATAGQTKTVFIINSTTNPPATPATNTSSDISILDP